MRNIFPEWYGPSKDDLRNILTTGLIVLDANVLLDLYRVGVEERRQILTLFSSEEVRERLWIPYQAAWEFQKNRVSVAKSENKSYENIVSTLSATKSKLSSEIDKLRDKKARARLKAEFEKFSSEIDTPIEKFSKEVKLLQKRNTVVLNHHNSPDSLRIEIDELFRDVGQVGPKPDIETLAQRESKIDDRYDNSVPPGYDDTKKDENRGGDLLIWFEILERAKSTERPILFVSSDTKKSWYEQTEGKTAGPRRELLLEIGQVTEQLYHQLPLTLFLERANDFLSAKVQPSTIDKINEITLAQQEEEISSRRQMDRLKDPRLRTRLAIHLHDQETAQTIGRFLAGDAATQEQVELLREAFEMTFDENGKFDRDTARKALYLIEYIKSGDESKPDQFWKFIDGASSTSRHSRIHPGNQEIRRRASKSARSYWPDQSTEKEAEESNVNRHNGPDES